MIVQVSSFPFICKESLFTFSRLYSRIYIYVNNILKTEYIYLTTDPKIKINERHTKFEQQIHEYEVHRC